MKITKQVVSVLELVPDTVTEIIKDVKLQTTLSQDDEQTLRLILEEAVSNAVRHGAQFDTSRTSEVSVEIEEKTIRMTVRDPGEGFDYKNIPDPKEGEKMKTSGRGIYLIKQLADEVVFNDKGTEMTITMKIS